MRGMDLMAVGEAVEDPTEVMESWRRMWRSECVRCGPDGYQ
jgi:hypothetical protein